MILIFFLIGLSISAKIKDTYILLSKLEPIVSTLYKQLNYFEKENSNSIYSRFSMVKSKESSHPKSGTSFYGVGFCTLVIVLASILIQTRNSPPLNEYLSKKISSTKPYETFEEFYD